MHGGVGLWVARGDVEHDRVEQEQRALLEERAAELAACGRRHLDDGVRDAGERAVRVGRHSRQARADADGEEAIDEVACASRRS